MLYGKNYRIISGMLLYMSGMEYRVTYFYQRKGKSKVTELEVKSGQCIIGCMAS